jgi:hypothetical protein
MIPRPRVVHYPFTTQKPLNRAVRDAATAAQHRVVVICGDELSAAIARIILCWGIPPHADVLVLNANGGEHYRGPTDVSLVLLANNALRGMDQDFAEVVLPALVTHRRPPIRVVGDLERVFTPEELEIVEVEEPGAAHLPK